MKNQIKKIKKKKKPKKKRKINQERKNIQIII